MQQPYDCSISLILMSAITLRGFFSMTRFALWFWSVVNRRNFMVRKFLRVALLLHLCHCFHDVSLLWKVWHWELSPMYYFVCGYACWWILFKKFLVGGYLILFMRMNWRSKVMETFRISISTSEKSDLFIPFFYIQYVSKNNGNMPG